MQETSGLDGNTMVCCARKWIASFQTNIYSVCRKGLFISLRQELRQFVRTCRGSILGSIPENIELQDISNQTQTNNRYAGSFKQGSPHISSGSLAARGHPEEAKILLNELIPFLKKWVDYILDILKSKHLLQWWLYITFLLLIPSSTTQNVTQLIFQTESSPFYKVILSFEITATI